MIARCLARNSSTTAELAGSLGRCHRSLAGDPVIPIFLFHYNRPGHGEVHEMLCFLLIMLGVRPGVYLHPWFWLFMFNASRMVTCVCRLSMHWYLALLMTIPS